MGVSSSYFLGCGAQHSPHRSTHAIVYASGVAVAHSAAFPCLCAILASLRRSRRPERRLQVIIRGATVEADGARARVTLDCLEWTCGGRLLGCDLHAVSLYILMACGHWISSAPATVLEFQGVCCCCSTRSYLVSLLSTAGNPSSFWNIHHAESNAQKVFTDHAGSIPSKVGCGPTSLQSLAPVRLLKNCFGAMFCRTFTFKVFFLFFS